MTTPNKVNETQVTETPVPPWEKDDLNLRYEVIVEAGEDMIVKMAGSCPLPMGLHEGLIRSTERSFQTLLDLVIYKPTVIKLACYLQELQIEYKRNQSAEDTGDSQNPYLSGEKDRNQVLTEKFEPAIPPEANPAEKDVSVDHDEDRKVA
ncbi:MAG: hypothetical protein JWM16_5654 [Verrucomicrobiales bacterium]|nr:hypothetical protein [Verrucomicrobiales bacterium]